MGQTQVCSLLKEYLLRVEITTHVQQHSRQEDFPWTKCLTLIWQRVVLG